MIVAIIYALSKISMASPTRTSHSKSSQVDHKYVNVISEIMNEVLFADEPKVEIINHQDYYKKLLIITGGLSFVIFVMLLTWLCCRRKKTVVLAEKTFIIKKKIILEKPDPDKCNDSLIPLVKIDYQPMQVDIDSPRLNSCDQYELPLDPLWEIARDRYAINLIVVRLLMFVCFLQSDSGQTPWRRCIRSGGEGRGLWSEWRDRNNSGGRQNVEREPR